MWAPSEPPQARFCTWTEALLLYLSLARDDAFTFGDATLSLKLWTRAGLERPSEQSGIRWHAELPSDFSICGILPPAAPDAELIDTLGLLQTDATASTGASKSYIHVKCFDLICPGPSRLYLGHDFFRDITRRSRVKSRALPWWAFKYHLSSLLHPATCLPTYVQPGQGLHQFPLRHLSALSPADAIRALGHSYMSTLAGLIRRWALAISSLTHNGSCHKIVPSWSSDDWTCRGCNRVANLTRDPQWIHKLCPSPLTRQIDTSPFQDTHDALVRLEARIRFLNFPFPLSPLGLPIMDDVLSALEAQLQELSTSTFAALLGVHPDQACLRAKLKAANSRWALILSNWQQKGHLFLPTSILATDGYCLGCSIRPKNLQSFLRRSCEHSSLSNSHSRARTLILSCHRRVASLQLSGGGFLFSWHSHAVLSFTWLRLLRCFHLGSLLCPSGYPCMARTFLDKVPLYICTEQLQ